VDRPRLVGLNAADLLDTSPEIGRIDRPKPLQLRPRSRRSARAARSGNALVDEPSCEHPFDILDVLRMATLDLRERLQSKSRGALNVGPPSRATEALRSRQPAGSGTAAESELDVDPNRLLDRRERQQEPVPLGSNSSSMSTSIAVVRRPSSTAEAPPTRTLH